MKISFKTKVIAGYFTNILVVLAIGFIYWKQIQHTVTELWDWILLVLILLSIVMLTVIYFIIKAQLKAKNKSDLKLLENKKLLQSIINNTTNPISVKKINGEYLLINKQYELLFNLKSELVKGKTDHDFLPKEIADRYRSTDLDVLKLGKEIQIEEVIEESNGSNTYLAVKFPLFDASNRVFAIGTIATNITDRKNIEQSLIAGNTFFNMSMDMLIIASKNKFIKTNPALSKTLGYTELELKNKPFTDFIFAEDVAITKNEIENLEKNTSLVNFKNRWICKNGAIKWLSWNATIDAKTGLLYAIAHDVTEQLKLAEEEQIALNELYASEQKLNLILENISDGVIVVNANKEVILANNSANNLFGIEDDSKIPAKFSDHFKLYFPNEEKVFPEQNLPMERAFEGEPTDNIEVILLNTSQKKKKIVLLSGKPIINTKNEIIAAVITIKDITKYKMMEAKLKTALKNRNLIGFKKDIETTEE